MKTCIKILLLLLLPALGLAQQSHLDSLKKALHAARTDSARYLDLTDLADYYTEINRDSALYYDEQALYIAKKNGHALNEAAALDNKGYILMHLGKYPESLRTLQQA